MYLTPEQERILSGEYGWIYSKALKLIVKVGEALGAEKLIPITHAHVSGISYTNIGEAGLEFIRDFYMLGAKARVYTTTNPSCIDLLGLSKLISNEHRAKQLELNSYMEGMGFKPTYTCIPYLHRRPSSLEHLAWGESSAVAYANSVLGAFTNREGGPIALAAALTGYTYHYGLHDMENRRVRVKVGVRSIEPDLYGALGLWLGENIRETPILVGVYPDMSSIKLLLAAAAASGDHALIVLEGITPKNTYLADDVVEKVDVSERELEKYLGRIDDVSGEVVGYIGCPHLDPVEFEYIVEFIKASDKPAPGRKLLLSVPALYTYVYREEIEMLIKKGVDIAVGTCPIVSILSERPDVVITNSGKAAFYLEKLHKLSVAIMPMKAILKTIYS